MDIQQIPQTMLAVPSMDEASTALNNARLKAAIGFEFMVELLSMRGVDPSISTKGALDISEHLYKVSGMAQKQAVVMTTPTVKFTFNATATSSPKGAVVQMDMVQEAEIVDDIMDDLPTYVKSMQTLGNSLEVNVEDVNE